MLGMCSNLTAGSSLPSSTHCRFIFTTFYGSPMIEDYDRADRLITKYASSRQEADQNSPVCVVVRPPELMNGEVTEKYYVFVHFSNSYGSNGIMKINLKTNQNMSWGPVVWRS